MLGGWALPGPRKSGTCPGGRNWNRIGCTGNIWRIGTVHVTLETSTSGAYTTQQAMRATGEDLRKGYCDPHSNFSIKTMEFRNDLKMRKGKQISFSHCVEIHPSLINNNIFNEQLVCAHHLYTIVFHLSLIIPVLLYQLGHSAGECLQS